MYLFLTGISSPIQCFLISEEVPGISIILNKRTSNSLKGSISWKNNFKHNFYTHRPSREKPTSWSFENGETKFNGEAILLKNGKIWHQYQTKIQSNEVYRVYFPDYP